VEALQNLLQYLRVNVSQVFANSLDIWQLDRLGVIVDRSFRDFVGLAPLLQGGVVEFTAQSQGLLKFGLLSLVWIDPVLESTLHWCRDGNRKTSERLNVYRRFRYCNQLSQWQALSQLRDANFILYLKE